MSQYQSLTGISILAKKMKEIIFHSQKEQRP